MADFIQLIRDRLADFTVEEFVALMFLLRRQYDYVFVREWDEPGYTACVWELRKTKCALKQLSAINCQFLGGPPGAQKIYNTTLLNMLTDRVLTYCCVDKKSLKEIGLT